MIGLVFDDDAQDISPQWTALNAILHQDVRGAVTEIGARSGGIREGVAAGGAIELAATPACVALLRVRSSGHYGGPHLRGGASKSDAARMAQALSGDRCQVAVHIPPDATPQRVKTCSGLDYAVALRRPGKTYSLSTASDRIGKIYLKALFRQHTNWRFSTRAPRPAACQHLGMLGPAIRAQVGDSICLSFEKQHDPTRHVHAEEVFYQKNAE